MACLHLLEHRLQALTVEADAGKSVVHKKARVQKMMLVCVPLEDDLLGFALSRCFFTNEYTIKECERFYLLHSLHMNQYRTIPSLQTLRITKTNSVSS